MSIVAGVILPTVSESSKSFERQSQHPRSKQKSVCVTNVSEDVGCSGRSKSSDSRCAYCVHENHKIDKCRDFTKSTIAQRWRTVMKEKLCYKCLKSDHRKDQCQKRNCSKCGRTHHELLHRVILMKQKTLTILSEF